MPSEDAAWHQDRRRKFLEKVPEAKALVGPNYLSIVPLVALVGLQWFFWAKIHLVESYVMIGFLAWLNSTTLFYSLSTFIHENSHGLVLGFKNRVLVACIIELAFVSFGEQWEYTVVHASLHHPHLNSKEKDSECPDKGHVAVPAEGFMKYLVPFIELLPLGTLMTQGQLSNNAQHGSYVKRMFWPRVYLSCVSLGVVVTLLVLAYQDMVSYKALLFAVWTTTLYASRWNIALHGQSIAEHYRVGNTPSKDTPPTSSTYHRFENLLGFNTGYHDEHHTFPNVPWMYLPKLKSMAPELFPHKNERGYLSLWWDWASHGFDTERFRICKH